MVYVILGAILIVFGLWMLVIWLKPDLLGGRFLRLSEYPRIWRRREPGNSHGKALAVVMALVLIAVGGFFVVFLSS